MRRRILVVDDDAGILKVLSLRLEHLGYEVDTAENGSEGLTRIGANNPDLALIDLNMPEMDGLGMLKRLQTDGNEMPVIVITAYGSIPRAVEAIRAGAYDILMKPLDFDLVDVTIKRAMEQGSMKAELSHFREESHARFPGVVGSSEAMRQLLDTAKRAAASQSTILLLGESGTGKEVLAHAVHNWSSRMDKAFITVNCAALSEQLLESELFGHEKGAFTGAYKARRGRFELASDGTIFLDEIAEMKPALQAKLLRVIERGEYERVGGNITHRSSARIVAATNQNLNEAVLQGRFRDDLYHRLNVVTVHVPPLRERKEDIDLLVDFFVEKHCSATKQGMKSISVNALKTLQKYDWPGNVRELENAIEKSVVLTRGDTIDLRDLPEHIGELSRLANGNHSIPTDNFHDSVVEFKKELIRNALGRCGGNQTRAAELLGMQRSYLARLIRQLEIKKG